MQYSIQLQSLTMIIIRFAILAAAIFISKSEYNSVESSEEKTRLAGPSSPGGFIQFLVRRGQDHDVGLASDVLGETPPSPSTDSPAPSISPTVANEKTVSPAPSVSPSSNNETISPAPSAPPSLSPETPSPTSEMPTPAPSNNNDNHRKDHHHHWLKILVHTIGWLVLAGASMLAFGACFGNRFRIYYYARGVWYSFLRSDATQWIMTKLRLDGWVYGGRTRNSGGGRGSSTLNDIIFEGGGEGLLMRET